MSDVKLRWMAQWKPHQQLSEAHSSFKARQLGFVHKYFIVYTQTRPPLQSLQMKSHGRFDCTVLAIEFFIMSRSMPGRWVGSIRYVIGGSVKRHRPELKDLFQMLIILFDLHVRFNKFE